MGALTEPVPKELRVDRDEINAGGRQPIHMKEIPVEFGIVKSRNGQFKCYNMTLPGGMPMTVEGVEKRQTVPTRTYTGTVEWNSFKKGFGFIKVAQGATFPPLVQQKIEQMQQAAVASGKPAA